MRGLMMDYQLSIQAILRRAGTLFSHKTVVSRRPDKNVVRHSCGEILERSRRLAVALRRIGAYLSKNWRFASITEAEAHLREHGDALEAAGWTRQAIEDPT